MKKQNITLFIEIDQDNTFDENLCRSLFTHKREKQNITFFIEIDQQVALVMRIFAVFKNNNKT